MISLCLNETEKSVLKNLIGKKLNKIRHDPFDRFGQETVYGRVELFFDYEIVSIDYDYVPYPLFGSQDDEHPAFSIKIIDEKEAISALENTDQINVDCGKTITGITLVEDSAEIEWDGKRDETRILKAIIIQFGKEEIAFQGDYMMPLIDIIKEDVLTKLTDSFDELQNDSETKFAAERFLVRV